MLKQSISLIPARPELYQAKLLFYLFIGSLGMFFVASLITYITVRDQAFHPVANAIPGSILTQGPDSYRDLRIPNTFWSAPSCWYSPASFCTVPAAWFAAKNSICFVAGL